MWILQMFFSILKHDMQLSKLIAHLLIVDSKSGA